MASDKGCLCVQELTEQEQRRESFQTASDYILKSLKEGFLPKGSLKSEQPLGHLHCQEDALSIPPSTPVCDCPRDDFFASETIGTKRSTSQLKLVTSGENVELSHHLLHACTHGLSSAAQLVVTTEADLSLDEPLSCSRKTNEQGFTPLAVAAFSNAAQVCELLIKAGAGVNSTDALQRSPLHWAVLGKCLSTVKVLLKHGASGDVMDNRGFTPLMYACILRSHDVVTAILKESQNAHGVDLAHNEWGFTPLMLAALQGSHETVKLLLKHGAQLSLSDKQGATAIHYAVWSGDIRCVKLMLSRGGRAVLSQRDMWGRTPLLIAAARGDVNVCKLLLKKGAWLAEVDQGGRTMLHWSVISQQYSCLEFLLNYSTGTGGGQALIHQMDNEGATPVHYAATSSNNDLLALLHEKGASVDQADHSGHSPLVWAATCGNVPGVRLLLGRNDGGTPANEIERKEERQLDNDDGNVHTTEMEGEKQLDTNDGGTETAGEEDGKEAQLDTNDGGTETAGEEEEKEAKSDTNDGGTSANEEEEENRNDNTPCDEKNGEKEQEGEHTNGEENRHQESVLQPLQAAASVDSDEVCLVLIKAGAKVNSISPSGLTSLHYASRFGHTNCAKLLLEHGAIVDATTPQQETGLHLACRYGHAGVTEQLLFHRAQIDLPLPPLGDCPVHLSSSNGHDIVLKVLIRHGCNVDEKRSSDHQSPLHLAASSGHLDCLKTLVEQGCDTSLSLPTTERLTVLDVAMLNDHMGCAEFLISCHAPSGGGAYHRAACTIQAVWKFYRHKCRVATARQWCAAVIQRAVRLWLCQRRAARVRLARERARHRAAETIQYNWKMYITQKRRYESTYSKLRARLESERVAAELIMTELQYQRHSVELPPATGKKTKAFTLASQSSPTNPRYLLRATANPISVFPSGSLLFPAKPQRPLIRRIPNIRVATKPQSNSKQTSRIQSPVAIGDSVTEVASQDNSVRSRDGIHLPPLQTNVSLTASLDKLNDGGPSTTTATTTTTTTTTHNRGQHQAPSGRESVKLPALRGKDSRVTPVSHDSDVMVIRGSLSHESVTRARDAKEKIKKPVKNSNSSDHLVVVSQPLPQETSKKATGSPVALQSQLKVTRHSTFKGTPLGYKPAGVNKRRDRSKGEEDTSTQDNIENHDSRGVVVTTSHPIREQIEGIDPSTPQDNSTSNSTEKLMVGEPRSIEAGSPNLDAHLYQQAQRYDKLNQVLVLLQQAKDSSSVGRDGGSGGQSQQPGTPLKISELKSHIKTALDEAVRLRADTEALQHKMINEDTGANTTATVLS